jgi:hypothetical protein
MRVLYWSIVLCAALPAGLVLRQHLTAPAMTQDAAPIPTASESLTTARQRAWEAAVIVQNPPHSIKIWQQAKVKWRQAIRLLEAIPGGTAAAAQAQVKLAVYRENYTAIERRLTIEQTAVSNLAAAQTLAWQAASTVQNPPHPLKVWQRASGKWQAAIALLEPIPSTASVFKQGQEKLAIYRRNYTTINQRIITEAQAQSALESFSVTAARLRELASTTRPRLITEPIGITHSEYAKLIQALDSQFNQFNAQPNAREHPIHADLVTAIADYKLALQLWQIYLDYKQQNQEWLNGDDSYNQLITVTPEQRSQLAEKYKIRPYANNGKISLKFTIWEIWEHAARQVDQAQLDLQPAIDTQATSP